MRARCSMPALISTIALLAGCGSEGRVEVSGVVRDRATGRVIAGARVVATDGSVTRTDASGRFTISVARGGPGAIRASAPDHDDAIETRLDDPGGALRGDVELELASHEPADEPGDPDAIVRWLEETWVDDAIRWSREHERDDDRDAVDRETLAVRAAIALLDGESGAHAGLACGDCHAAASDRSLRATLESDLDAHACAGCHDALPAEIGGSRDRDGDGIAGAASDEVARARARARAALESAAVGAGAARCGRLASLDDLLSLPLGDCDGSGAIDGSELELRLEDLVGAELARRIDLLRVLEDDRSRGLHDATRAIEMARAIERAPMH